MGTAAPFRILSVYLLSMQRLVSSLCVLPTLFALSTVAYPASSFPQLVERNGHYALFVDGAPYLILGAQVNNSSAWPAMLPKVWPAIEEQHANTVEMPIYWEQFEPQQHHFDYTVIDILLTQAREHHLHLVLLWFGTWKNGSGHYTPEWMKLAPTVYPHMLDAKGQPIDSLSPHSPATLEADTQAFSAFMRHLKAADPQHTVIMVQVENEPGTWGAVRDQSPAAEKLFQADVPASLLKALNSSQTGTWQQVFGPDADEFFHAWSVASYIGRVAAAGKAIYPLPLYSNAALRDPINPGRPPRYESGGPTDNVLSIWKAAAPALDLLAPDIYLSDTARYEKVLDLYSRPDNALFVPETGNSPAFSPVLFAALGHGAIGFSPFGLDYTGYSNAPLGATRINEEAIAPFAMNYKLIAPIDREIARLNFEGKLQAVTEQTAKPSVSLSFGTWKAEISYGLPQFGSGKRPPGNSEPIGRALVAQLAPDEFLVTGFFCRVDFSTTKPRQFLSVEEGSYQSGKFIPARIWNGDQTDYGLNFTSAPQVLRVKLSTY